MGMSKPTCNNCKYIYLVSEGTEKLYHCTRYPEQYEIPISDWCGEWKRGVEEND